MLRVYDSETEAGRWFTNATMSRTAEEMKAQMEQVAKKHSAQWLPKRRLIARSTG
jgi:hypothetical protein